MFRSEIGSGFEDPGGTTPPRIPPGVKHLLSDTEKQNDFNCLCVNFVERFLPWLWTHLRKIFRLTDVRGSLLHQLQRQRLHLTCLSLETQELWNFIIPESGES